jgi:hypothetical protein
MDEYTIYCFWTGDNPITPNRAESLQQLKETTKCDIILINKNTVQCYILAEHPLHPAYEYLSETHKADYLRTYFMHFYGGGYCDIKKTRGSWVKSFDELRRSDAWICGYKEIDGGIWSLSPVADKWSELIGNGAYICKPGTPLTSEWYNEMISLLDKKHGLLILNPSTSPQDCSEKGTGYPLGWNELLSRIFHPICYKYKNRLLNTLPGLYCNNYR